MNSQIGCAVIANTSSGAGPRENPSNENMVQVVTDVKTALQGQKLRQKSMDSNAQRKSEDCRQGLFYCQWPDNTATVTLYSRRVRDN